MTSERRMTADQTSAPSSSSRPLSDTQSPEPSDILAPLVPSISPQTDAQPAPTPHFSTAQSEVRAGALRIETSNPEQCFLERQLSCETRKLRK